MVLQEFRSRESWLLFHPVTERKKNILELAYNFSIAEACPDYLRKQLLASIVNVWPKVDKYKYSSKLLHFV